MRLIDADKLYLPPEDIGSRMAVAYAPTAYDVDKVVEELKKYQELCFSTMANTRDPQLDIVYEYVTSTIEEAIDIVRGLDR